MKLRKHILKNCICFFLLLTVLCGCQHQSDVPKDEPLTATDAAVNTSKVTIGAYGSEEENPLLVRTNYNEQMNFLIYDSLYTINSKFEAEENLAAGYEIQNSGYSVTVYLKPNVVFHDGSALTAQDVKSTISFIKENQGYYSYHTRNIQSVSVIDDTTLQLELSYLTPNLKLQLTFPILCKKQLLSQPDFSLNGTGPYQVASQTKGKQIILEKNKNYHGKFSSNIKTIEVSLIPDREAARSLAGSGMLDIFYSAFFDEGLKSVTKYESYKSDYLTDEYTFLTFNFNSPHIGEKKFRKALYQAVSRDKIKDDIFMTHAESTYLPLPPGSWAYNDSKENVRNIDESKRLLSELGYSDVDNNTIIEIYGEEDKQEVVFHLLSIDDPTKKAICEQLISDFKEIGIGLQVTYVTKEEFPTVYGEQLHDLYLITTNIGYDLDPKNFFDGLFSAPVGIQYDSYLKKFATADKLELKQPEFMRLCDEFYETIPHIPLVFLKNTMLTGEKVGEVSDISPSHLYNSVLKK
ncbi:MAG: ABC transporter substrate-binding protein [Clostridia bacterium]|nr:ABC transporter substrate-binding protein [Clostridia bacterium]